MNKWKLQIVDTTSGYYIGWSDGGEVGLLLGQAQGHDANADTEVCAAESAAAEIPHECDDTGAFVWESLASARKARRIALLALDAIKKELPLPDWAVTALREGWTPPRGWKP